MHPHKMSVSVMNEAAAAIRVVFPKHAPKELARLMNRPIGWARECFYRRFSNAHRRDLARALLTELDRQDVARTAWRRILAEWAAEDGGNRDEVGARVAGVLDRRGLAPPHAQTRGASTMIDTPPV